MIPKFIQDMRSEAIRRAVELTKFALAAEATTGQAANNIETRFRSWQRTTVMDFWQALRMCKYLLLVDRPLPWEDKSCYD